MSPDLTFVGSLFCGVSVFVLLFTIYVHVEGNRVAATRFVFHDIRREMKQHPLHKVWWRAFRIAMGRRKHGPAQAFIRNKVSVVGGSPETNMFSRVSH